MFQRRWRWRPQRQLRDQANRRRAPRVRTRPPGHRHRQRSLPHHPHAERRQLRRASLWRPQPHGRHPPLSRARPNSAPSSASCASLFIPPISPPVLRLLDHHFGGATYSLKSLFRDERQKVVSKLLGSTMAEAEAAYRQIYEHHAPLMGFLSGMGAPLPKMLHLTAEFVLNTALRKEFMADELDLERVRGSARNRRPRKNPVGRSLARLCPHQALRPHGRRARPQAARRLCCTASTRLSIWCARCPSRSTSARVQNVYYHLLQNVYPMYLQQKATSLSHLDRRVHRPRPETRRLRRSAMRPRSHPIGHDGSQSWLPHPFPAVGKGWEQNLVLIRAIRENPRLLRFCFLPILLCVSVPLW